MLLGGSELSEKPYLDKEPRGGTSGANDVRSAEDGRNPDETQSYSTSVTT